jgi:acetolactate synthase I/II/III large subunit
MAPLARLSKTVGSSKNLNHWFRHALTTMWSQPRGPVHLSLTHDALTGECAADYVKVFGYFAGGEPLSVPAAMPHWPSSRTASPPASLSSPALASNTMLPPPV